MYDAANRLLTAEALSGITTYSYDAAGNRRTVEEPSGDVTTYTWNAQNQTVQVELPSDHVITYVWAPVNKNSEERIVRRDDGVEVQQLLWDNNNVLRETDDVGTVEAEYTYQPQPYGDLVSDRRDSESNFYRFDALGSTTALTDTTGHTTDEYRYTAFGKAATTDGTTETPYKWIGQLGYRQDDATGLHNLRARDYDPQTGQFVSADPLGLGAGDSNFYRYAANDPISRIDPNGLQSSDEEERLRQFRLLLGLANPSQEEVVHWIQTHARTEAEATELYRVYETWVGSSNTNNAGVDQFGLYYGGLYTGNVLPGFEERRQRPRRIPPEPDCIETAPASAMAIANFAQELMSDLSLPVLNPFALPEPPGSFVVFADYYTVQVQDMFEFANSPQPAQCPPLPVAAPTNPCQNVAGMRITERLQYVLTRTLERLPEEFHDAVMNLLSPEALVVLALVALAQLHPVSAAAVDAVLLSTAVLILGSEACRFFETIGRIARLLTTATTCEELDEAAQELAEMFARLGAETVAALALAAVRAAGRMRRQRQPVTTPPRTGPYGTLRNELPAGEQANHLNQNAAFRSVIPENDGLAVGMRGNAITEAGSPHYNFHQSLEQFWNQFRRGGPRFNQTPTNAEYGQALQQALEAGGFSSAEAQHLAAQAAQQRAAYGLLETAPVPRIPGRTNQTSPLSP